MATNVVKEKIIDYLEAIRSRDNEKIKMIYTQYFQKVQSFVILNNGSKEDAKDIFDLAIYQISARLEREHFDIKSNFEAYLFTACKNLWRRELNKKAKRRVTSEHVKELYYEEKQLVQATLEQERWELFNEKLKQLSENCSMILQLFFNQHSSKEIMSQLNYENENTVRQRIFKCKQKLISLVKKDQRYIELKHI